MEPQRSNLLIHTIQRRRQEWMSLQPYYGVLRDNPLYEMYYNEQSNKRRVPEIPKARPMPIPGKREKRAKVVRRAGEIYTVPPYEEVPVDMVSGTAHTIPISSYRWQPVRIEVGKQNNNVASPEPISEVGKDIPTPMATRLSTAPQESIFTCLFEADRLRKSIERARENYKKYEQDGDNLVDGYCTESFHHYNARDAYDHRISFHNLSMSPERQPNMICIDNPKVNRTKIQSPKTQLKVRFQAGCETSMLCIDEENEERGQQNVHVQANYEQNTLCIRSESSENIDSEQQAVRFQQDVVTFEPTEPGADETRLCVFNEEQDVEKPITFRAMQLRMPETHDALVEEIHNSHLQSLQNEFGNAEKSQNEAAIQEQEEEIFLPEISFREMKSRMPQEFSDRLVNEIYERYLEKERNNEKFKPIPTLCELREITPNLDSDEAKMGYLRYSASTQGYSDSEDDRDDQMSCQFCDPPY